MISVLIGAALGVLGYFVPLISILSVIFALIYVVLAVKSPEFSFMTTLLILPFLPAMDHGGALLAALVCLTVASFAFKVLLGKRVFHFEQYDLILLLFFIFILVSGIFNKGIGSFESAAMMIILAFGYFLSGNILVNRRLADNAAKMIIFSSFITALFAIFFFTVHPMMKPEWIDSHFGGIINARMTAFFGNPNIYAVFLITPLIFSLTFTLDKTRGAARLYYLLVFLLNSVAMLFTYTRGAWLALVLAVPAFFIIHGKRTPKLLLLPVLGIPLCAAFLPQSFTDRFLSIFNVADSSVQSRLSTWRASLSMFFDNFFTGVGIGEESFREEFAIYSENGLLSGGNHAHNLWLEIGCEAGIFALLLFMLLPLVRARHIATYKHYISSVSLNTSITMTSVTVFALLAFGMTDYIWYSSPLYYLFWVVFGMGSAMLRIGKREYDELIDYRYSGSSAYKASIDIGVTD